MADSGRPIAAGPSRHRRIARFGPHWWRRNWPAVAFFLALSTLGLVLALQGWRVKAPAFDMVTYFRSAAELIRHGSLPGYGDVSSYGSFSPPGTSWLMAPGMLLLDDPRLYEKVGSGALHIGTLLGVFLLAQAALGRRTALVSTAIYGLSMLGLDFAGSLWPIGHPFFYVWAIYFAIRWVRGDRPAYLAAGLATCGIGMYQDLAIAPVALVFPVLWLIYRPRLAARPLLAAAVVVLLVWSPYLRFEADRGFADLASLLLRRNIEPADYRTAWCDPSLVLIDVTEAGDQVNSAAGAPPEDGGTTDAQAPSPIDRFRARLSAIPHGLLATFNEATRLPGVPVVLLALVMSSTLDEAVRSIRVRRRPGPRSPPAAGQQSALRLRDRRAEVALIALAVPWLVLLALAEPDRPERFFWLWPLQAVWLAAFFTRLLPRLVSPEPVLALVASAAVALMAIGPVQARVGPWLTDGWAGSDPEEMRVVEYLASDILASGRTHASVGYHTFIYEFMATYNVIDPHYKVGAEFDLLLEQGHGIVNANRCAEGISRNDEYRIVQTRRRSGPDEPSQILDVSANDGFRLLARFGLFDLFKRA